MGKLTCSALAIGLALSALGCSESSEPTANQPQTAAPVEASADIYEAASQRLFRSRPVSATLYGLSDAAAGGAYAHKVDLFDPASEAEMRRDLRVLQAAIEAMPTPSSVAERENQEVMASVVRYFAGNADFPIGYIDTWMGLSPFIINQINGPLIDIPGYMKADQPIRTEKDAQDYLARLASFDRMTQSVIDKFQADAKTGWLPPKVTLNGALRYLANFLAAEPAQHSLVTSFVDKLNKVDGFSAEQKAALTAEAVEQVTKVVYPAYKNVVVQVEAALPKATDASGIWAQPKGAEYYQDAIHMLGDSDLSAEQIHNLGLSEVTRISKEMDTILVAQGYQDGSVGARMAAINEEPKFLYEDSDAGRAVLLADINGYITEMTEAMAPLFKTAPPYAVEVRAFSKETQDGAPGGQYTSPSVDGSKPGIYWINLRDMKANPTFGLKTLTYHEANPGHHWQVALNLAQEDLPFLRRIAPYNAYAEGWALYSERLAAEMGMYKDDPFSDLGRLQAELFRAVRLVVDTGMHHKQWTREQAIDYMASTTGTAQSDVVSEIERYMAWPGQALGYKLGQLKILSIREAAKAKLGDKFDLAEFHDVVLLGGAVPMHVLEEKVNAWLTTK
ncbi:DUF885 domain-containing protein [Simiduia curdlanivorans]|uniref:DUF885 domain-containing protein n=1 Tax=Simiduia curdlanivorans TaxID=1492769 RepID=A0ABV8V6E8_9GAMM|nr:DUF885 domain-containing protein [Simiduia curdlanivorans]MDN3638838.1 DUF885 domain-containing protein [Simiduia curdlanivorans]